MAQLRRGAQQPFYHVLADSRDWQDAEGIPPLAYVAEELLRAPEVSPLGPRALSPTTHLNSSTSGVARCSLVCLGT